MELKDYQQQALDTLDRYLEALKEAHQQADKTTAYLASDGNSRLPDRAGRKFSKTSRGLSHTLPGKVYDKPLYCRASRMHKDTTEFQNTSRVRVPPVNRFRISA